MDLTVFVVQPTKMHVFINFLLGGSSLFFLKKYLALEELGGFSFRKRNIHPSSVKRGLEG
jgi:hypothetical protein